MRGQEPCKNRADWGQPSSPLLQSPLDNPAYGVASMVPMWFARRRSENASLSIKSAALLVVAAFLVAGFAMPLGAAQESGGGSGGGGPSPGGDANNTTSPALPDLVIASLRHITMDEPCCEPMEPTPETYAEPCCESVEPTPEEPEPCCPHDPPVVRYVASFEVMVGNEGLATAEGVVVRVAGPETSVAENIPSLEPGERVTVFVDLNGDAGTYVVSADVDPGNVIVESDESNNGAVIEARFGPEPKPDLVLDARRVTFEWNHPGELTVFYDVHNVGDADAGRFRVLAFFGATMRDSFVVDGLPAGDSVHRQLFFGRPTQDGTVAILVDALDQVQEHNEWNNEVHLYHQAARLNLAVSGLSTPDVPLVEGPNGPEALVRFQVSNDGELDAYDPSYLVLVDGEVVAGQRLDYVARGETVDVELMVPAAPGVHLLEVEVEAGAWRSERDETDNHEAAIADFGFPNLATSISVADTAGARYNDAGILTVTVTNDGRFGTPATKVAVRDGARLLAMVDVAALGPGASEAFDVAWTLSPGVHTFGAFADPQEAIREADDRDNLAEATLDLGLPQLAVTTLTWEEDTPEEGRPVHVHVAARYDGQLGLPGTTLRLDVDGAAFDHWTLGPLAPGESFAALSEWHPNEGDHTLTAIIDQNDAWAEANETDNLRTEAVYVRAPTPVICTSAPDAQETCRRVLLAEEDPLLLGE